MGDQDDDYEGIESDGIYGGLVSIWNNNYF